MKRSLFLLLTVALFAACTKDFNENSVADAETQAAYAKISVPMPTAIPGMVVLRVDEAAADRIESGVTRSGGTRSGIESLDMRLDEVGVENFHRVFPVDDRFEADHRAAGLHLWYYVTFDQKSDLMAVARVLSLDENIESLSFNHTQKHFGRDAQMIPLSQGTRGETEMPYNDPLLPLQWHYNNDASVSKIAKVGADVNAFEAWKVFSADENAPEIIVAVVDEPVQATHPDLQDNMWVNPDPAEVARGLVHGANFAAVQQPSNEDWYDPTNTDFVAPLNWELTKVFKNGQSQGYAYMDHGSHVAGTIAAVNNNGIGVGGVAGGKSGKGGNVKIMSCQIYRPIEQSHETESTDICTARALVWAADRGAAIANNSWGYEGATLDEDYFKKMAVCAGIDYFIDFNKSTVFGGKGLLFFSAGNSGDVNKGKKTCWPGAYSRVLGVSAIGPDYTPAYYSDYGPWVDLSAPGGDPYKSNDYTSAAPYNSLGSYGDGCVLSTIIDPKTANTKNQPKTPRTDAYAWSCGTSMSCPHAVGVAALGAAYAASINKTFTLEEYKSMLLTSTISLKPYLSAAYGAADMGAGAIDALKLLCNIAGYPAVTVLADGELNEVSLKNVMGGVAVRTCMVKVSAEATTRLGITSSIEKAPQGVWRVSCTNPGVALVTVSTQDPVGGTVIAQPVLLVAKSAVTSNGGWL